MSHIDDRTVVSGVSLEAFRERQLELLWYGLWAVKVAASMDESPKRCWRIADALAGLADVPLRHVGMLWSTWQEEIMPSLLPDLPLEPDPSIRAVNVRLTA